MQIRYLVRLLTSSTIIVFTIMGLKGDAPRAAVGYDDKLAIRDPGKRAGHEFVPALQHEDERSGRHRHRR